MSLKSYFWLLIFNRGSISVMFTLISFSEAQWINQFSLILFLDNSKLFSSKFDHLRSHWVIYRPIYEKVWKISLSLLLIRHTIQYLTWLCSLTQCPSHFLLLFSIHSTLQNAIIVWSWASINDNPIQPIHLSVHPDDTQTTTQSASPRSVPRSSLDGPARLAFPSASPKIS